MPPHCTVHMLGNFIAFLSYMKLKVFGDSPMIFQLLPHFAVSTPSTRIPWHANFDSPSMNLVWSDTHFVRNCESHSVTAPLRTMPLRTKVCNRSDPKESERITARRVFLEKNQESGKGLPRRM